MQQVSGICDRLVNPCGAGHCVPADGGVSYRCRCRAGYAEVRNSYDGVTCERKYQRWLLAIRWLVLRRIESKSDHLRECEEAESSSERSREAERPSKFNSAVISRRINHARS